MSIKKHILLVAPYITFPNEPGANRFITIATKLSEKYRVTLVTSKFCHILKAIRNESPIINNIDIILIDEPGYKKNVSLSRLYSHYLFCKKFDNFLSNYKQKIDLVYSAYPLIKTNFILAKYKRKYGYKLIIDIQDIWPEAISGPIPFFSSDFAQLLMRPVTNYANLTYSFADGLVAVSETYLYRGNVNKLDDSLAKVVYIGADDLHFTKKNNQKKQGKILVTYIGTMAGSYDLETVVKAASLCHEYVNIQFIGTGPDEKKLRAINSDYGNHVNFLGSHNYENAMKILVNSDIALNPIKSSAKQSITNKLSDYFCCGLPIVSCQQSDEVIQLLALGGGMQYYPNNSNDLAEKLIYLSQNRDELARMSLINQNIAKKKFIREQSYKEIYNLIDRIIDSDK